MESFETVRPPEATRRPDALRKRASTFHLAVAICAGAVANLAVTTPAAAQDPADLALKARIEAVLVSASDLPADSITVEVSDGVVTLSGSVVCEECGGRRTPTVPERFSRVSAPSSARYPVSYAWNSSCGMSPRREAGDRVRYSSGYG